MELHSKNIYLIGMMGCGKSTVGKLLAKNLGVYFADIDFEIEMKKGETITEIFSNEGETHFRNLETQALKSTKNSIVACGGGIVLRKENRTFLRSNGIVILLIASLDELFRRISDFSTRPLLNKSKDAKETLRHIWDTRKTNYKSIANHTILTDGLTPEQVCNIITDKIL
ncbi:MAG: shikimate kinase [Candidatus Marinimicrobia bacterium]|nr:shikimate kinase [Candidatus Neomarinimicrobiota bacterium]|tara:strand:+ start:13822 stop:14331 length:510 start_codon:yes stop_codon:yes gene_type:complete